MFAAFQVYESTQNCISGVTAVYPRTINSFAKLLGTVRGTYDYSYLGGLKVVEPKHTGRSVVTRRPSHFNESSAEIICIRCKLALPVLESYAGRLSSLCI